MTELLPPPPFEVENRKLINWGLILLLMLSIVFLVSMYASRGRRIYNDILVEKKQELFLGLNLEAQAIFVWDIHNKKALYEKNAETVLPLASITKIIVAITASDLIPRGTTITLGQDSLGEEGDSGLFVDEDWKLSDLIDVSLVASSNDAATAIASLAGSVYAGVGDYSAGKNVFIEKMNQKAAAIGMNQTRVYRENGLDSNGQQGGAYGTARDVARLFEYTLANYPSILEGTKYNSINTRSLSQIEHRIKNTNPHVGEIPSLIASKTGYTELSRGNLATVIDPGIGRPIVLVVLGSSYDGRFKDMLELSRVAALYLSQN